MEFNRIADQKRVDFILQWIKKKLPAGGDILDLGCGNGVITRAIGRLGYRVTGIDVSEKTISRAKAENTLQNVEFRAVSAEQLVSEPARYDVIVCSEVLEHLDNPETVVAGIHWLLSADGLALVTVPNGRGPRELLITRPVQRLQRSPQVSAVLNGVKRRLGYSGKTAQSSADDLDHRQFFTLRSLRKLAARNGFQIIDVRAGNFVEEVFPLSWAIRRSRRLQRFDCRLADMLPIGLSSGFMTCWKKLPE